MAGGKETPRQKMIGMMYLVLTALLALNVSKEIVNAFITLNDKIESGNKAIQATNEDIIAQLNNKVLTAEAKQASEEEIETYKAILDEANGVHNRARGMSNFLIMEASDMIKQAEGADWYEGDPETEFIKLNPLMELGSKDNYDIPTNLFVGDPGALNARGKAIVDSMHLYRDFLLTKMLTYTGDDGTEYSYTPVEERHASPEDTTGLQELMDQAFANANPEDLQAAAQVFRQLSLPKEVGNHDEMLAWIAVQFDHSPIVAAAAIFTSLRSDVLQSEQIALNLLNSRVNVPPFNFDTIDPVAFAPSSYINQGDSLNVTVNIAAYNSKEEYPIYYWSSGDEVADSTARAQFIASGGKSAEGAGETNSKEGMIVQGSIGDHTIYYVIGVKERGILTWKPGEYDYKVGAPTAAIANYETNILYAGYDNKVVASGGGADPNTLNLTGASTSKTKFDGGQDGYIVKVQPGKREVTLTLQGEDNLGNSITLGSQTFRVERLPDPLPFLADVDPSKGVIQKGQLRGGRIIPKLVGSPLQVTFSVKDFVMEVSVGGRTKSMRGNGATITPEMYNTIKDLRPGANIAIRNTRVIGPAGVRICPSVSYKLK